MGRYIQPTVERNKINTFYLNCEEQAQDTKHFRKFTLYSILYLGEWSMRSSKPWVAL
jgi:hypothetical protein